MVPDRRHLVMVVPGIGGSVLARPGDRSKVVWDAGFGDVVGLLARPGRLSLAENPHLTPVGLIKSKRLVPGWTVIEGYDRLWNRLARLAGMVPDDGAGDRVSGANLVASGTTFAAASSRPRRSWAPRSASGWRAWAGAVGTRTGA